MPTLCTCPPGNIPDITDVDCDIKFDLIVRMLIGRVDSGSTDSILIESELDVRLAATDATKVQFTPLFADTEFPGSEIILTGQNDNTSPFGEGFRTGETSVTFTATFANLDPVIKDQLKQFECFSDLGVAFIDAKGKFFTGPLSTDASPEPTLIPISNFFVGTRQFGGRTDKDFYAVNFTLAPEWDCEAISGDADYNPLTKTND